MFYLDSFVAKSTSDKQTTLDFYEFMVSDKILDIYIKGKYTNSPRTTTYLLPPTRSYLRRIAHSDYIYKTISQTAFTGIQLPLYQREFGENVYSLAKLIDTALQNMPTDADTLTSTESSEAPSAQPSYLRFRNYVQ